MGMPLDHAASSAVAHYSCITTVRVIFIEVNITARDMTFSTGWQTLSIDCAMGDSVLKVWYLIPGQITGSKRCFSTGRLEHSFNPLTFLFFSFSFPFLSSKVSPGITKLMLL
jgi:hypothetical protein